MLTRRRLIALSAALPAIIATRALAAQPEVFSTDGIAINGYDPVAYFTEGRPVEGSDAHQSDYMGASFRFASAANKATFDADPAAYAPQYGGYCAYAVSLGAIATTEPEAWTIHEGRLYLNNNLNVRDIWSEDIPGNVTKADANWPDVLN